MIEPKTDLHRHLDGSLGNLGTVYLLQFTIHNSGDSILIRGLSSVIGSQYTVPVDCLIDRLAPCSTC